MKLVGYYDGFIPFFPPNFTHPHGWKLRFKKKKKKNLGMTRADKWSRAPLDSLSTLPPWKRITASKQSGLAAGPHDWIHSNTTWTYPAEILELSVRLGNFLVQLYGFCVLAAEHTIHRLHLLTCRLRKLHTNTYAKWAETHNMNMRLNTLNCYWGSWFACKSWPSVIWTWLRTGKQCFV